MLKNSQFQSFMVQQVLQDLQDCSQQPTAIQPAIRLPISAETSVPLPPAPSFSLFSPGTRQESTVGSAEKTISAQLRVEEEQDLQLQPLLDEEVPEPPHRRKRLRIVALVLCVLFVVAIYLTWHSTTSTAASPVVSQQSSTSLSTPQISATSSSGATGGESSGSIQTYIVGAVRHPGVYTLPANARVYQLIQAAGGTLPGANLVALDLAAKLSDGQEIYVLSIGETPPSYVNSPAGSGTGGTPGVTAGQLININTASEAEMRQGLHVSASTAQKIIAYRSQHGAYTSVDQLLQVVSKSIYDRIKNMVTV
jgi:competence protein ComEA